MRPVCSLSTCAALGLAAAAACRTPSQAQFFTIDPLAPHTRSPAIAVSADGRVVVGFSENVGQAIAYAWTREEGRTDWLGPGVLGSYSYAISEDGRFDVGQVGTTSGGGASLREIATGQFLILSHLTGYTRANGLGVSRDGGVTVGRVWRGGGMGNGAANASMAVRWDASGAVTAMGYLHAGDTFSEAAAVTPDGGTVVGSSRYSLDVTYPWRWTAAAGMVGLQLPQAGFPSAVAKGVSADGRYVVGHANVSVPVQDTIAVRWNEAGLCEPLPLLPGYRSGIAFAVTPDGRTVAGEMQATPGPPDSITAFVWREGDGTESLAAYLRGRGVEIPQTMHLIRCSGVSADGTMFVGKCFDTVDLTIIKGFVAVLPPACRADFNKDGGIDGADVEAFFDAWENARPGSDVNGDGGIDGADVERFIAEWAAGGCG
ncbi:MAG: hypothetical protein JNK25_14505 [Phycisphaerae bacterium]|nr:hypothetical protein [Phycisphaerae bacterium]